MRMLGASPPALAAAPASPDPGTGASCTPLGYHFASGAADAESTAEDAAREAGAALLMINVACTHDKYRESLKGINQ